MIANTQTPRKGSLKKEKKIWILPVPTFSSIVLYISPRGKSAKLWWLTVNTLKCSESKTLILNHLSRLNPKSHWFIDVYSSKCIYNSYTINPPSSLFQINIFLPNGLKLLAICATIWFQWMYVKFKIWILCSKWKCTTSGEWCSRRTTVNSVSNHSFLKLAWKPCLGFPHFGISICAFQHISNSFFFHINVIIYYF